MILVYESEYVLWFTTIVAKSILLLQYIDTINRYDTVFIVFCVTNAIATIIYTCQINHVVYNCVLLCFAKTMHNPVIDT